MWNRAGTAKPGTECLEQVGLFSSRSGQTVTFAKGVAAHLRFSSWDEDGLRLFADLGAGRSSSGDVTVTVGPARSAVCSFLQILEQVGLFSSRSGQTVN